MKRVVLAASLALAACETSTRFDAEAAARAWLSAMNLRADGVACAGDSGQFDYDWRACSVRFGSSTQLLWCRRGGCKADASFVVPPAAVSVKITEAPR